MENTGLRRHVVKGSFVWDLPDIERNGGASKAVGLVANDWQLSGVLTAGSGSTYDVTYSDLTAGANVNLTGSPSYAARVRVVGDPGNGCSSNQYGQFNTAAFANPAAFTFGNSPRSVLRGPGVVTTDLTLEKSIGLGGDKRFDVRVEAYNLLNRANFHIPGFTLGAADFGAVSSARPPRTLQIGSRFSF